MGVGEWKNLKQNYAGNSLRFRKHFKHVSMLNFASFFIIEKFLVEIFRPSQGRWAELTECIMRCKKEAHFKIQRGVMIKDERKIWVYGPPVRALKAKKLSTAPPIPWP